jgi:hypothetical protein
MTHYKGPLLALAKSLGHRSTFQLVKRVQERGEPRCVYYIDQAFIAGQFYERVRRPRMAMANQRKAIDPSQALPVLRPKPRRKGKPKINGVRFSQTRHPGYFHGGKRLAIQLHKGEPAVLIPGVGIVMLELLAPDHVFTARAHLHGIRTQWEIVAVQPGQRIYQRIAGERLMQKAVSDDGDVEVAEVHPSKLRRRIPQKEISRALPPINGTLARRAS